MPGGTNTDVADVSAVWIASVSSAIPSPTAPKSRTDATSASLSRIVRRTAPIPGATKVLNASASMAGVTVGLPPSSNARSWFARAARPGSTEEAGRSVGA
jgi:hypothetical protein